MNRAKPIALILSGALALQTLPVSASQRGGGKPSTGPTHLGRFLPTLGMKGFHRETIGGALTQALKDALTGVTIEGELAPILEKLTDEDKDIDGAGERFFLGNILYDAQERADFPAELKQRRFGETLKGLSRPRKEALLRSLSAAAKGVSARVETESKTAFEEIDRRIAAREPVDDVSTLRLKVFAEAAKSSFGEESPAAQEAIKLLVAADRASDTTFTRAHKLATMRTLRHSRILLDGMRAVVHVPVNGGGSLVDEIPIHGAEPRVSSPSPAARKTHAGTPKQPPVLEERESKEAVHAARLKFALGAAGSILTLLMVGAMNATLASDSKMIEPLAALGVGSIFTLIASGFAAIFTRKESQIPTGNLLFASGLLVGGFAAAEAFSNTLLPGKGLFIALGTLGFAGTLLVSKLNLASGVPENRLNPSSPSPLRELGYFSVPYGVILLAANLTEKDPFLQLAGLLIMGMGIGVAMSGAALRAGAPMDRAFAWSTRTSIGFSILNLFLTAADRGFPSAPSFVAFAIMLLFVVLDIWRAWHSPRSGEKHT